MVSSTPQPHLTPGKDPVPILHEAGWAPAQFWRGGKSRLHRDSIPDRPSRSSVAITTELPGPQYLYIFRVKCKGKVHPCTGTQALIGRTAHRGSRGIALLFLYHGTTGR